MVAQIQRIQHQVVTLGVRPKEVSADQQGVAVRKQHIDDHLALAAKVPAADIRSSRSAEAVSVSDHLPVETAEEPITAIGVVTSYLAHDLTTPLIHPVSALRMGSGPGGGGSDKSDLTSRRQTWDIVILPDRPGSFVNVYA